MPTARRTDLAIRSFRQRHDRPPITALAPGNPQRPHVSHSISAVPPASPDRGSVRVNQRQHFAERRWLQPARTPSPCHSPTSRAAGRSFISAIRGATGCDLNSMAAEPRRFQRETSCFEFSSLFAGRCRGISPGRWRISPGVGMLVGNSIARCRVPTPSPRRPRGWCLSRAYPNFAPQYGGVRLICQF